MLRLNRNAFLLFAICLAAVAVSSCRSRSAEQRYELKGKVVHVDKKGSNVSIDHEEIAGFMGAMTMPFKLKNARLLDELAAGDRVQATLVVAGNESWLEDVVWMRDAGVPEGGVGGTSSGEPAVGNEVPDFTLTNQDAKPIRLNQYRGKAVVLTFTYTRCPLPDYCPLMTSNFQAIDRELREKAAFHPETMLLSITVDPEFDTPKVLREFGDAAGADYNRWTFATGSPEQIKKVANYFGLTYWPEGDQIIHSLRTAVIGPDGKLVSLLHGNQWKPEQILSELRSLKIYRGVGVIETIYRDTLTVQLNHEEIPGLMPKMNMPYKFESLDALSEVNAGDAVEFTLKSTDDGLVVTSIRKR